uniref:Uncharacterized protein n=1 Tax=Zooxanthella nutricula TaxID=1333877 RepID=A0A7S2QDY8_9DINO
MWESVQTFIHESSHLPEASTLDVLTCKEVSYFHVDTFLVGQHEAFKFDANMREQSMPFTVTDMVYVRVSGQDLFGMLNESISGNTAQIKNTTSDVYLLHPKRFSQDGAHVLVEAMPDGGDYPMPCYSMWGDLDLAYGEGVCQRLAKEHKYRSLLNADSFGYYIVDVAERFYRDLAKLGV